MFDILHKLLGLLNKLSNITQGKVLYSYKIKGFYVLI